MRQVRSGVSVRDPSESAPRVGPSGRRLPSYRCPNPLPLARGPRAHARRVLGCCGTDLVPARLPLHLPLLDPTRRCWTKCLLGTDRRRPPNSSRGAKTPRAGRARHCSARDSAHRTVRRPAGESATRPPPVSESATLPSRSLCRCPAVRESRPSGRLHHRLKARVVLQTTGSLTRGASPGHHPLVHRGRRHSVALLGRATARVRRLLRRKPSRRRSPRAASSLYVPAVGSRHGCIAAPESLHAPRRKLPILRSRLSGSR